jgi:hypothetical protein
VSPIAMPVPSVRQCAIRSTKPSLFTAWPPFEPARRATMILGRECTLDDAPVEAERQLLERWSAPDPDALARDPAA